MIFRKKTLAISIWVAVHVILLALGFAVPWKVESDLYSVLPAASELKSVGDAEQILSTRSVRNLTVLLGHGDFEKANEAAQVLEDRFHKDEGFESTRLKVDDEAMEELQKFFFDHRYLLQGTAVNHLLKHQDGEALKNLALQKVYGAFSLADLNHLEEDPFLLGAEAFEYFSLHSPMMSGKFTLRQGVLAAEDSSVFYVMWNAALAPSTSSMASEGHVLQRLNQLLDSLQQGTPGLRIEKSGVPFHSYESSKNAQQEVAWISGISITLILLVLLLVFRTSIPILCTLATIGIAICAALSGTWFLFGKIHLFTFVFGTSVIGVSIDYAIHFFTHWKKGDRNFCRKGLMLGFMTTELSYVALTFANFPLLRQMALFSIIGLASSFLTILLLLPHINLPYRKNSEAPLPTKIPQEFLRFYQFFDGKKKARILVVAAVIAFIPGIYLLHVHTDMRTLYAMSDALKKSEALSARLNNLGISPNYFIVEGSSAEELLQHEESLTQNLVEAQKDSLISGYLATTFFIPSQNKQRQTLEGIRQLAKTQEYQELKRDLALQNDSLFIKSLSESKNMLTPDSPMPPTLKSVMDMLWIGNVNGRFYSAVFPLHAATTFDGKSLARGLPFVHAVNKMENINDTLTSLSRVALALVAVAYFIVFLVLIFVYGLKQAFKVIRAPVISCFFIAAFFGYGGIPFNFFAIIGVILTLGIGIDYSLFFKEGGKHNLTTTLAVMLSSFTTLISFGSLYFSSFVPVSTFGLSVLLGILCCFILSPFSRH